MIPKLSDSLKAVIARSLEGLRDQNNKRRRVRETNTKSTELYAKIEIIDAFR